MLSVHMRSRYLVGGGGGDETPRDISCGGGGGGGHGAPRDMSCVGGGEWCHETPRDISPWLPKRRMLHSSINRCKHAYYTCAIKCVMRYKLVSHYTFGSISVQYRYNIHVCKELWKE